MEAQSCGENISSITSTASSVKLRSVTDMSSATRSKNATRTLSAGKKRKLVEHFEETGGDPDEFAESMSHSKKTINKAKRPQKQKGEEPEEKRLRRHRAKPPGAYLERLQRVRTQRMFLIDRKRTLSVDGHEEEVFDIAGSTGNIYEVTISKVPECTCPDASKGNQCKHIIYVMVNVLKAQENLVYQLALLSTELTEIFANAPVSPQSSEGPSNSIDKGGSRKPVEGDCPVCVMEFEAGEDIIWCRAACGNNVHRLCFEQWAKSKAGAVKCVYCRTPWKSDEERIKKISKCGTGSGTVNEEGYVNVAGELGISTQRDMSSYHSHWVNRQYGGRTRYGDYGDDN